MTDFEAFNHVYRASFDEDSPEQVNFVMQKVVPQSRLMLHKVRGEVVSALLLRRYQLKLGNDIHPISYIYGACTRPAARGKGYMAQLLKTTVECSRRHGDALCCLIPANEQLFGYYECHGFKTLFYHDTFSRSLAEPSHYCLPFSEFDRLQLSMSDIVTHSRADYDLINEDLKLESGKCAVLKEGNEIKAAAWLVPEDNGWRVKSVLAPEKAQKNKLLLHLGCTITGHHLPYAMAITFDPAVPVPADTEMSLMLD